MVRSPCRKMNSVEDSISSVMAKRYILCFVVLHENGQQGRDSLHRTVLKEEEEEEEENNEDAANDGDVGGVNGLGTDKREGSDADSDDRVLAACVFILPLPLLLLVLVLVSVLRLLRFSMVLVPSCERNGDCAAAGVFA